MVPHSLIERVFGAAAIQRWNDRVRPIELTELDKQAHKAMIAFVLARFEEDRGARIDWVRLIEGILFEFLPRVVLTDIKAPFFHRLMKNSGDAVNAFVLQSLEPEIAGWDGDFAGRFRAYLGGEHGQALETRVLRAAHYLATQWEFKIVYHSNPDMYGIEQTKTDIENQMEDFIDLIGVRKIGLRQRTYGFIDLCGQLRFQQRWAQIPRTPLTAVLGHSFFVGALAYLISLEIGACRRRLCNNFFGGLFHDLPEIFTRDIISPVKRSIVELEHFIEEEEASLVRECLLPLLPEGWHTQLIYYVDAPFENKVRREGKTERVSADDLHNRFNTDDLDPIDGGIIRGCDELAAFVEACKSLETGIHPPMLVNAARVFLQKYAEASTGPVEWGGYFRHFASLAGSGVV